MYKIKKYNSGFSLFEMLIVIFIIGVMSSFSYISYNRYNQKTHLQNETNKFVQILELAKKKSNTGDISGCTTLDYHQVVINSATQYKIESVCFTGGTGGIGSTKTYNFSNQTSVEFYQYTSASTLFNPLSNSVIANCIIIKHTKLGSCQKISINGVGLIENVINASCSCS